MNKRQFKAILAKYPGVTLDEQAEREGGDLILDSPAGKVFAATGCHVICEPFRNTGGQSWKSEAYAEAAKRLEFGLRDCDIEDCDHCEEMQ